MEYQTLLIITIPAAMVHITEEYKFGWVKWANSFISGVTVRQFIIINCFFMLLCILAAILNKSLMLFSSSIFSLLLINSVAHIAPTIKQRKYSPGLFSAILLFIPIGTVGYSSILSDNLMSLSELGVSIIIGLFWMSIPFIYQAIRITSEKRA